MADDIEALLGDKPDVTIECSGVETSIRSDQSIYIGRIIKHQNSLKVWDFLHQVRGVSGLGGTWQARGLHSDCERRCERGETDLRSRAV